MGKGNWFRRERKRVQGKSRKTGAAGAKRERFRSDRTILSLEPLEDRRVLATFTVTTLDDTFLDGDDRVPFAGSLRAAVNAANETEELDTILFAVNGEITLNGGQMEIVEPLRILGNAARILTIDAGGGSRIFTIADDDEESLMPVEISGLTLSGGNGTGGEEDDGRGGAIRTFENLTMTEVIFDGNDAGGGGGAVFVGGGRFTLSRSLVTGNSAQGVGGGGILLDVDGESTDAPAPRATVVDSTFFGNSVSGEDAEGGAMLNVVGGLTVRQSTVVGNSSESNSDGIAAYGAAPEDPEGGEEPPFQETVLLSSIIYNNRSDDEDADATDIAVVGEAIPPEDPEGEPTELESTFVSLGWNIYGPTEERFEAAAEDLVDVNPLLTEGLVDFGGATPVLYPDSTSPAIDSGSTEGNDTENYRFNPTQFEQRGRHFVRMYGYNDPEAAVIDIGAVEIQAGVFDVDLITDESDGQYSTPQSGYAAGDFALREAIRFSELNPEIDRITFNGSLNQPGGAVITLTTGQSLSMSQSAFIEGPDNWLLTVAAFDPTPLVKNADGSRVFAIDDGAAANVNDFFISNMTIANADAAGFGGAVFSRENLTLQGLTIRNNGASLQGGGVYMQYGDLYIDGTTINNNRAGDDGGGIYVEGIDGAPEVVIIQSTISGNLAADRGAGITNDNAHVTVKYSTITNNKSASTLASGIVTFGAAGVTEIGSTIVAGNVNNDLGAYSGANAASYLSLGYNIIGNGNSTASFVGPGDLRGVLNPKLDPLAITGGRVATHRPQPGSPAINGGDPSAVAGEGEVPEFDQRGEGFSRIYDDGTGGRIDVGSYETQPNLLVVDANGDADDGDYTVGNLTLREAVNIANLNPLRDTIVFDMTTLQPSISIGTETLQLLDSVSILGPGSGILALQYGGMDVPAPIFTIDDETAGVLDVEITGLEMRNGVRGAVLSRENLILDDILFLSNSSPTSGGALFHEIGSLSLSNSLITGNSTNGANADGGAIFIQNIPIGKVADISFVTIAGNRTNQSGSDGGGLAIVNSIVIGSEVTISGNSSFGGTSRGGGLFAIDSNVSLDLSVVSGNSTIGSNAVGGALAAYNSTIALTGYTILNLNSTLGSQSPGGAIFMSGGSLLADGAQFAQNSTLGQLSSGGAIALQGVASAIISDSAVVQNSVAGSGSHGGALYHVGSGSSPGTVTIRNSLLADNHATHAQSKGGAVYSDTNLSGTQKTTILNSTISGNSAPMRGGGVFNADGLLEIFHSTITNNSTLFMNVGNGVASQATAATQTKIYSSIIAGNVGSQAGTGSDVDSVDGASTNSIQSLGYNVIGIGNAQAAFNQSGDKPGIVNPLLAPLNDNGGDPNGAFPLLTHALLPGSPAINAGSPAFNPNLYSPPLTTDQRGAGFARVKSGRIDAGAFESDLAPALPADFNGNGAVDGADFLTWQRNFGKTGGIKADGDANGDGNVNGTDLTAWKAGFGSTAASAAASSSSSVNSSAALMAEEETVTSEPAPTASIATPTSSVVADKPAVASHGRFDSLASLGRGAAAAKAIAAAVLDEAILWNGPAAPTKRVASVYLDEEKSAELELLLAEEAGSEAEDAVFAAWGEELL